MDELLSAQRTFVGTALVALDLLNLPPGNWDVKYDLVFDQIKPILDATGVKVEWCDPDAGYEDDVRAYLKGVQEAFDKLKPILDQLVEEASKRL
jgi:hypothetical protein